LAIVTIIGLIGCCEGLELVQRVNYGVVFQESTKMYIARDYWFHTFEFSFPEDISLPQLPPCHSDNNTCALMSQVLLQINSLRTETESRLNNTLQTLFKLLPESKIHHSRSKRSLLPFVGTLSKGLFGTATMDDVNVLANHINKLNKVTMDMNKALTQQSEHFSSFVSMSNKRMDNLMTGVKDNMLAIKFVQVKLQSSIQNIEYVIDHLMGILVDQIETCNSLNNAVEEFKLGVFDMLNEKLTPLLLPTSVLESTLSDIESFLSTNYTGFYLNLKSVQDIYAQSKFLAARNGTKLYVTLKIPVSSFEHPLTVFKLTSLPIPINDTSAHATQLLDLQDYFVISADHQYYATMTKYEMLTCQGSDIKYCTSNLALSPVTKMSCALALFANDKSNVKTHCNFRYLQNVITPKIVEISPNVLLLYRTPLLSLQCNHGHRMEKGCNFCIFNMPCRCSVSTNEHYFASRLSMCHHHDDVTIVHPVNLALLQHFFDESFIEDLSAESTFAKPLNVSVPAMNLSKMATLAKSDSMIFQSLSEPLLDGTIKIPTYWPDTDSILLIVTMCVTVILAVLLFKTIFKVRALSIALITLQQTQSVKALPTTLPSFIYTGTSNLENVDTTWDWVTDLSWDHANFVLLVLCLCCVIVLMIKLLCQKQKPHLCLELSSSFDCVQLIVTHLPPCPSQYEITPPYDMSMFQIVGSWYKPYLSVSWGKFEIINKMSQKAIPVRSVFPISIIDAIKLKNILAQPFDAYLYKCHGNVVTPLDFT
jgi:hypothetical protein